jgi:predicted ArsR family transcriptional regulator
MTVRRGVHLLPWLARTLGEETRHRAYVAVLDAGRPLSRLEVADALGIRPGLAAFHLDKLADEGLLDVHYARPSDRPGGPGAGRPAKQYRPSGVQIDLTIPPRRADVAARVLALTLEQLGPEGAHRAAMIEQATACGRDLAGVGRADLRERLTEIGYDPVTTADDTIELRNCPFHPVVAVAPETTCALNLALLGALADAKAPHRYDTVLEPTAGRCCVLLRPTVTRSETPTE